jgi:hypothetical protein
MTVGASGPASGTGEGAGGSDATTAPSHFPPEQVIELQIVVPSFGQPHS